MSNDKKYNVNEYRERQEIIGEIKRIYSDLFDIEKRDLNDLTTGELKEYLDDMSSKQPIIEVIHSLLENSDIDFGGLEEMELSELIELQERLESNND